MKNLIVYFSATGNTERMVDIVADVMSKHGDSSTLVSLPSKLDIAKLLEDADRLVVACPAFAMQVPVFIKRWLRDLPGSLSAKEAIVLVASGGDAGPAAQDAASILARRGYRILSCGQVVYPENWTQMGVVMQGEAEIASRIEAGDAAARKFGEALYGERPEMEERNGAILVFGRVLGFLFGTVGRRFLGKMFVADERCTSCGICEKGCPASTILLKKSKSARPYWRMNCENCNRCMNICPENAINTSIPAISLIVLAIVALSAAGVILIDREVFPRLALATNLDAASAMTFVANLVWITLSHVLAVGPVDALLLRWVRTFPAFRKFFSISFSRNFTRYKAPGFKGITPAIREKQASST